MKLSQRDEMKEQQRLKKEGVTIGNGINEEGDGDANEGGDDDDDNLFGEDEDSMDVS